VGWFVINGRITADHFVRDTAVPILDGMGTGMSNLLSVDHRQLNSKSRFNDTIQRYPLLLEHLSENPEMRSRARNRKTIWHNLC
jgi:hypothetical protein